MSRKLILSLDGGGIRGVFTMGVLVHLHHYLSQQRLPLFAPDMVAGTSIGAAVGALVVTQQYRRMYELIQQPVSHLFFHKSIWDEKLPLQTQPKYDGHKKRQTLTDLFGTVAFKDTPMPFMVPVYNVSIRLPEVFHSWDPHRCCPWSMVDVLDATSAAPVMYPAVRVGQSTYIDGGVALNNPSVLAFTEATALFPKQHLHVLSLGTGHAPATKPEPDQWGAVQWMGNGLVDILSTAPDLMQHEMMKQLSTHSEQVCYMRLDSSLPGIAMDDNTRKSQDALLYEAQRVFNVNQAALVDFVRKY